MAEIEIKKNKFNVGDKVIYKNPIKYEYRVHIIMNLIYIKDLSGRENCKYEIEPGLYAEENELTLIDIPELDSIDALSYFANNKITDKILEKEKGKMEILDLYKERKESSINKKYEEEKDEIIKNDPVHKILTDTENELNVLLDRDEENSVRLRIGDMCSYIKECFIKETERKLQELDIQRNEEITKLNKKIQTLTALFELTEDYTERLNILKKYKVIDKDLQLIVED